MTGGFSPAVCAHTYTHTHTHTQQTSRLVLSLLEHVRYAFSPVTEAGAILYKVISHQ